MNDRRENGAVSPENRLLGACNRVGEAAKLILDWVDGSNEIAAAERVALLHEVYRAETTASKLSRSLYDHPSIAFVGPARSGKSQLISTLADGDITGMSIQFDGMREQISFPKYLAPEGVKNGIAAVLRFTSRRGQASASFPVMARLLSLADVVKILGGMFLSGAAPKDLEPCIGMIDGRIAAARAEVQPVMHAGLSEEDVWDIRYYFTTRFGEEALIRALLTRGYWESLTAVVGHLPNRERGELLSVLWGGDRRITAAFVEMADALATLDYGRDARCALDAVLGLDSRTGRFQRRADSVASAATMAGLVDGGGEAIVVSNQHGQWVSVPRCVFASVLAELRLPLATSASPLLAKADLLEFPAVDARQGGSQLVRQIARDPLQLGTSLMRAKAHYLLERSIEDQAITALAVCVEPASSKVGELAGLVSAWIERTHGADVAARERQANGLFVCLTKLDREFAETKRRGRDRRIDFGRHITSIVIEGLGHNQGWPQSWTSTRAFDNVHLLRAPHVRAKHLINYASDGRELGIKADQAERIARAKQDFLSDPLVRRHVADPAAVWSEAFELNDGGTTLLSQSLEDVCDEQVKQRHVLQDLSVLGRALSDRLRRYHVSGDFRLQKDRRKVAALAVTRWLRRSAESQRLGHLIRGLQIADHELADAISRSGKGHGSGHMLNGHAAVVADAKPYGGATTSAANGVNGEHNATADAERFAAITMSHWVASVRLFAQADRISETLQLPRASLLQLVDELIAGATRIDLEGRIASEINLLARSNGGGPDASSVNRAALCAANLIGEYVMWLGFTDERSNAHPRRKGRAQVPIFPPKPADDPWALPEGDAIDTSFCSDWSRAFLALVTENAEAQSEAPLDADRNRRLGQLLAELEISL